MGLLDLDAYSIHPPSYNETPLSFPNTSNARKGIDGVIPSAKNSKKKKKKKKTKVQTVRKFMVVMMIKWKDV
jgi:hypothetical protein